MTGFSFGGGGGSSSDAAQKIKARFEFTLADLKTINTTYEFVTGVDGQHTVWPFMTTAYNLGGGVFTPATTGTFANSTIVTATDESCYTFAANANCKVSFKFPNVSDTDVDNNSQGLPLVCIVVNGVIEKLDAASWNKSNHVVSMYHSFSNGDVVQIGILSGNVDGSDRMAVVDSINESDTHLLIPDSAIGISWVEIEEI